MKRFVRRLAILVILLSLTASAIVTGLGYFEYKRVVNETSIQEHVSSIQNHNNYVHYDMIAPMFIEATVATEDARYWSREGTLDFEALGRAIVRNIRAMRLIEGGSTIPQQIAKNFYFGENTSIIRKVAEVFIARDLLANYSKKEIIALYANMNYYGDGYTGIYQASVGYFKTTPYALSEGQATILAGLPQAPSVYQLSTNFEGAKKRQHHVLTRLFDVGYISKSDIERIYQEEVYIMENHQ